MAHPAIGFGCADMRGDARSNLASRRNEFFGWIGWMLECGFEQRWRVSNLLSTQRTCWLAVHKFRKRSPRPALRFDEEQRDQALCFEGVRHVGRHDCEGSTGDTVFKMETELTAQGKGQLVGVVCVLGDAIGRVGAGGHIEHPKAAAFPERNSARRHRVHCATIQPRALGNKRRTAAKQAALPTRKRRQTLTAVRRREFAITETDDKAMAAAAIIGDRRSPVIG